MAVTFAVMNGTPEPLPSVYSPDVQDLVKKLLCKAPKSRPTATQILNNPLLLCVDSELRRLGGLPQPRTPRKPKLKSKVDDAAAGAALSDDTPVTVSRSTKYRNDTAGANSRLSLSDESGVCKLCSLQ